jgi:aryl-alcohol dehydrogenase-like predicted oxidoreductase
VEYRRLGSTGVDVSALCLGAMMFGPWGNTDQDECVRMIHTALEGGVNFVDTADVYGEGASEEIVGRALKGRRDDVFLATKFFGQMGEGHNRGGGSRYWIMREIEESLRRLGTDHIDLYQMHRPDPDLPIEETLGALTDVVHQGKVRYLGCSTFPAFMIVESRWASDRRGLERFVCEQPPYSIFVRQVERDILPVCRRYRMGVIVWSPLAGGWLAGRYRRGQDTPADSRVVRYRERGNPLVKRYDASIAENQHKLDLVEDLIGVADRAGLSLAHLAVAFTLAHPAVTSAIIGPRTPEQLDDLLSGADVRLDDKTLDAIDELVPPGEVLADIDRGYSPPWLEPEARRRGSVGLGN